MSADEQSINHSGEKVPCYQIHQDLLRGGETGLTPRVTETKLLLDQAIHNYPDKNLPTLLVYYNGEMKTQFVGLSQLKGESMTDEGT